MTKHIMCLLIYAVSPMIGQLGFAEEMSSNQALTESSKLDAPQFSPMASELGKFQHKLYLSIGKKWNQKVQQTMEQIEKDRVVFKFHVNPDGSINNIEIVEGNPNSKLATISKEAIAEGGRNCGPFSELLKKDKPDGFDWQLAYRIY